MTYKLILTAAERSAIDWIGNRYATGSEFKKCLLNSAHNTLPWDVKIDLTFHIPESVAWEIKQLFDDEGLLFPCFSQEFVEKLMKFYESIV